MIQEYLELLARELDFDRSLSRCVRQEVEDHLWEAVAANSSGDTPEAQRRAVANFGDARAIAAQFAVVSLARRSRRAGVAAVLVIAGVFIAMKTRIAWYAAAQWTIGEEMRAVSALVVQVDRYAFWLSVVVGLGGWIYIRSRQIPAVFNPAYRRQLGRFFLLCGAAAAAGHFPARLLRQPAEHPLRARPASPRIAPTDRDPSARIYRSRNGRPSPAREWCRARVARQER